MKRVNLKQYPRFWNEFIGRVKDYTDPSAAVSSHQFKLWIAEWYGINVYVMSNTPAGEVYMLESDYVAFLLRWA